MATLMAVYSSQGCVGRCDAKCYDATGEECNCICGGANHGVGLQQAIQNTTEHYEEWLAESRDANPDIVMGVASLHEQYEHMALPGFGT